MTAEPLTPEEEAVIREWASEDHGESIKFTPTDLSRLLAALDAARKSSPPLDVERLRPLFREYEDALLGVDIGDVHPDRFPGGIAGSRVRRDAARDALRAALDPTA